MEPVTWWQIKGEKVNKQHHIFFKLTANKESK